MSANSISSFFTQVYHPNIDTEGNICLNILREDWKPVLSINSVVYGLNFLFLVRSLEANVLRSARQAGLLSSGSLWLYG
jgi:ubiquitin-protein ligase